MTPADCASAIALTLAVSTRSVCWESGPPLIPLLHDQTGATLAGVAKVDGQRWYFLPRGADTVGVLRWLMQQALPTWAPGAVRAAGRSTSVDEGLQTPTERSLRADLAELQTTYARRREALETELTRATEEADRMPRCTPPTPR